MFKKTSATIPNIRTMSNEDLAEYQRTTLTNVMKRQLTIAVVGITGIVIVDRAIKKMESNAK